MDNVPFELSAAARLDLLQTWNWLAENPSLEVADRVLADLEQAMYKLVDTPSLGHRRRDLTPRRVLFYLVHSWYIIYVPKKAPLHVLRVLHASRNVKKVLRDT